MSVDQGAARSATTGEPVSVVARRNRLGVWLCIVSDVTGVVALLIAYSYLWSLNVNNAWAPPNNAFANPLDFWLVTIGGIAVAGLIWLGYRAVARGSAAGLVLFGLAVLLVLATLVLQIVQLSTFPFDPTDGSYASATFWLCIGAAFHLSLVLLLTLGILGRTRAGLISQENPYHARLVAMYATWAAVAIFLGALFATTMTVSPNTSGPAFGQFTQPKVAASTAPSPASSPGS